MTAPFDLAIGVDLGGTKTEAIVLRLTPFEELVRLRVPTLREEGYDAIVTRTADIVREAARRAGAATAEVAIGVGMPGSVTRRDQLVKNSNTTCLNGRPFRADLTAALGHPVEFANDANCFALAEARMGAGRPYADGVVFGAILGTGIGGGIAVRGEVWEGAQNLAGEWGHHGVWAGRHDARACYCGHAGCLEAYLSGSAVEADFAARSGRKLSLSEIATIRGTDIHANAAIETMLDAFGRGFANLVDILDPSAIVLGGGVSNLELLLTEGRQRVQQYVFNDELVTPILGNELGDSAGVIGAALRALGAGSCFPSKSPLDE